MITRSTQQRRVGVPFVLQAGKRSALIRMHADGARAGRGVTTSRTVTDNVHRLNMGVFPDGARSFRTLQQDPGLSVGVCTSYQAR